MNNVMIDIETLGSASGSALLSIGAIFFDIESGVLDKHIYIEIDLNDSLKHGMSIEGDKLQWWLKQSNATRKLIHSQNTAFSLKDALEIFSKFLKDSKIQNDLIVWGNSAKYVFGILSDAYNKLDLTIPWNSDNERCLNTFSSLKPKIKDNTTFVGIKHYPLHDCEYQIEYCNKIWVELFPPSNIEKISSDNVYELKLKIPREFIHIGISNNIFFGRTDSTETSAEINYKLPDGEWSITNSKGTIITLKNNI